MAKLIKVILTLLLLVFICACTNPTYDYENIATYVAENMEGKDLSTYSWTDNEMKEFERYYSPFQQDNLIRYLQPTNNIPEEIPLENALEDVEILFSALQSAYSGYDYFGGAEVFDKYKNAIIDSLNQSAVHEEQSSAQTAIISSCLEQIVGEQLERIICDSHFSFGNYPLTMHHKVYMYYVPDLYFSSHAIAAELQEYIKQTITPEGDIACCFAALSADGKDLPATAFIDGSEVNLKWTRAKSAKITDPDTAFGESTVDGIPIITSRTMTANEQTMKQLKKFSSHGASYQDSQITIIDLRGNGGGNSMYAREFLENYLGSAVVVKYFTAQKCCRLWLSTLERLFDQEALAETIERVRDNDGKWISEISNGTAYENDNIIFVLVDKNTASAAEDFLLDLSCIPNVWIVGSNSAGCSIFGNIITLYLPNSGINVQFGTKLTLRNSTNNTEGIGILPDLWVPPSDALESVLALCKKHGSL